MLFTCEHCTHQFESDASSSGFVRCPECHKPTASEGEAGVQEVTCSSCGTNYALPADKFTAESLVVACKKCGNKFEVLKEGGSPAEPDLNDEDLFGDGDSDDDMISDFDDEGLEDDLMPDFDDEGLGEDLASGAEEPEEGSAGEDSLEMGSVEDLDENEDLEDEDEEPDFSMDDPEDEEDISFSLDGEGMPDVPAFSLDDDEMPEEPDLEFDVADLPDEDELTDEERGMFLAGSGMPELASEISKTNGGPKTKSKAPFWAFFAFVIFLGVAVTGLVLRDHPDLVSPEQMALLPVMFQPKQDIQLSIQEPLKGRWVKNHQLGPIFVLSGTLKSFYPAQTRLSQIQISGRLLDGKDQVVGESKNLAGHLLSLSRVGQFNQAKLESFSALDVVNPVQVDPAKPIPFQVLFLQVHGKVQKLEAQINGFVVGDQPIQVR